MICKNCKKETKFRVYENSKGKHISYCSICGEDIENIKNDRK